MPIPVTCPSGLSGRVRALKVREANMLADTAAIRRGTTFDSVLSSCWEATGDLGPYAPEVFIGTAETKTDKLDWSKVLVADRLVTMIQIRIATYGPMYAFTVQCGSPSCRKSFTWEIDLAKDVPIKLIPDYALAAFANGNRLETHIDTPDGSGLDLVFKLLIGSDESKARALRGSRIMTDALAARIVEIRGTHANDRVRLIEDFDMPIVRDILAALDSADGGVETDLDVECPECQNVIGVALPFGKEFYMPSTTSKRTTPRV